MLTRVAGATHDERRTAELCGGHRHVLKIGRQSECIDELRAARPLHGDDAVVLVMIVDDDARWRSGTQRRHYRSGVRRVGDHEDLIVTPPIDDQVIDDAAGLVEQHRVLRVTSGHAVDVIGEHPIEEVT